MRVRLDDQSGSRPTLRDVVRTTGRSWIVMEFVRSRSLSDRVARDGPMVATEAADLWSLGVTLHTAVEGYPPLFRSRSAQSSASAAADEMGPPGNPGPLHRVIAGLLAADPAARTTAARTQDALQALADRAVGVSAVPAPRLPADNVVRFQPAVAQVSSGPCTGATSQPVTATATAPIALPPGWIVVDDPGYRLGVERRRAEHFDRRPPRSLGCRTGLGRTGVTRMIREQYV